MAQTRTADIRNVSIKQTSKGDLYVVDAGGTEYSTFARGMAEQARQLIGQTVQLRYTEKLVERNGQTFTNRYYEGAEPTSGGFGNGTTTSGFTNTWNGPTDIQTLAVPPIDARTKDLRIMRQTATKVAAWLMPHLPENERTPSGLIAMAEFLVDYYQDGPSSTLNDPGPEKPPFTSDDDIPF